MFKLKLVLVLLVVASAYGSGGGGGHGAADAPVEGTDDVRILKMKKKIEFICDATGNSTLWTKEGEKLEINDHIKINGNNLTIVSSVEEDVGAYKAQSTVNASLSCVFELVLISYKNLPKSTTALEGDQFSLTCDAEGNPDPTIIWTKDDVPLELAVNGTHRLEFRDSEKGLPNATFVLTDIRQQDRGHYTCSISNHPELHFNSTTNVRVKDIYAALWPFLGIVAEVVVLCVVIFVYEKRRSKNDFDESDTDTNVNGRK